MVELDIFEADKMALAQPDDGTPDTRLASEAEEMALGAQPDVVTSGASLFSEAEEVALLARNTMW
jgi:hypothetical protein